MGHFYTYADIKNLIFYMSKEICSYHEKDQRYTYCLEKLEEKLGHKFEYYIIKDPDFTEAHDFDKSLRPIRRGNPPKDDVRYGADPEKA